MPLTENGMSQAIAPTRKKREKFKDNLLFFSKFLKHGTKIASIWPSSPQLARATIKKVDWAKAKVVVELGAGTGPITEAVIAKLKPHTHFIAIERDKDFAKILQERFSGMSNVEIVCGDVRDLSNILKERGIKHVDYFVSGLPTPSLPPAVRKRMFASVRKHMAPGGGYSNITEIPLLYWQYYKKFFKHVHFDFVPVNMPPAGVYHCKSIK